MKHWYSITGLATAALLAAVLAACGGQPAAAQAKWFTRQVDAGQASRDLKRPLLIAFVGSDWNAPSQRMQKDVLDTAAFKEYADANLVLLMVDFPRNKPLSPEASALNAQLAKLCLVDNYPSYLVVDTQGNLLGRIVGAQPGGPAQFIAEIKSVTGKKT